MSSLNVRVFFLFLIVYCLVVFDCCLLVARNFLKGDGRGMDLLVREIGEVEGVETVAEMQCLREESSEEKNNNIGIS